MQSTFSMGHSPPVFHLDQSLVHSLDHKEQHLRPHDDHQFSWTLLIQMLAACSSTFCDGGDMNASSVSVWLEFSFTGFLARYRTLALLSSF